MNDAPSVAPSIDVEIDLQFIVNSVQDSRQFSLTDGNGH